jgi:hypothetical protein
VTERILLAFRRHPELVDDEHLHDGYISIEAGGCIVEKTDYENVPFKRLINRLASAARTRPHAGVFMMLLDRKPEPLAIELRPDFAKMLREDPVRLLDFLSPAPVRVSLRSEIPVRDNVVVRPAPLRTGYDTLAENFGDAVYCKRDKNKIESPLDGRWADVGEFVCKTGLSAEMCGRWWAIQTMELIDSQWEHQRFYLPREWNTSGPWIHHADLKAMYVMYVKEKRACSE